MSKLTLVTTLASPTAGTSDPYAPVSGSVLPYPAPVTEARAALRLSPGRALDASRSAIFATPRLRQSAGAAALSLPALSDDGRHVVMLGVTETLAPPIALPPDDPIRTEEPTNGEGDSGETDDDDGDGEQREDDSEDKEVEEDDDVVTVVAPATRWTPVATSVVVLSASSYEEATFGAVGSVKVRAGVALWRWHSGHFAPAIERTGPGRYVLSFAPTRGLGASMSVLITPRVDLASTGGQRPPLTLFGAAVQVPPSASSPFPASAGDPSLAITVAAAGGDDTTTALADLDFDVAVLGPRSTQTSVRLHGYGSVIVRPVPSDVSGGSTANVRASLAADSGTLAHVEREGLGRYVLHLAPGRGVAAEQAVLVAGPRWRASLPSPEDAQSAPPLRSVATEHLNPTTKRLYLTEKATAAQAPQPADFPFDVALVRATAATAAAG